MKTTSHMLNKSQLPLSAEYPNIVTNNHERPLIFGYELTEKEQSDFDYINDDDMGCSEFIRYKGDLYHTADLMGIDANRACLPFGFSGWQCYESQTFFSGVLFKFSDDGENVICARYFS